MPKSIANTQCGIKFATAAKGIISDTERKQIFDAIDANKNAEGIDAVARSVTGKVLSQKEFEALQTKRTELLNIQAQRKIAGRTENLIGKGLSPKKAFEADSIGMSGHPGIGERNNAEARRQTLQHVVTSRIASQLKREKLQGYVKTGAFDKAIMEQRWKQNTTDAADRENIKTPNFDQLKPEQQKAVARVAQLFNEQTERMRQLNNARGGLISKKEGYGGAQSHDTQKIRNAANPGKINLLDRTSVASKNAYQRDLARLIDMDATRSQLVKMGRLGILEDLDPKKFMDSLWNIFALGVRKEPREGGAAYGGNIAADAEKARILQFKGPAEQAEYSQKYGKGTMWESHLAQLRQMSHVATAMEFYGPSVASNFSKVMDKKLVALRDKGDSLTEQTEIAPRAKNAEFDRLSRNAVERYQFLRNKEAGQKVGTEYAIVPAPDVRGEHLDEYQKGFYGSEEDKASIPDAKYALLHNNNGKTGISQVGDSIDELRPKDAVIQNGWGKKVDSFSDADAGVQRSVADSEAKENPSLLTDPVQRTDQANAIYKQIDDMQGSQAMKYLEAFQGTTRDPGNMTQARVVDNLMAVERMALLGGSIFSNIPVFWTSALQGNYAGVSMLKATFRSLFGVMERIGRPELRQWGRQTGVGTTGMLGQFASSMMDGFNGHPGSLVANLESKFFKMVGLTGLKDMLGSNYVFMTSNEMAHQGATLGKGFADLPANMQRHLGDYDISPREWDIIRQHAVGEYNGYQMLASDKLQDVPLEEFAGVGGAKTKTALLNARINTEQKLANLFRDSADYATVEPDLKTRQLTPFVNGTRGTISGDLGRLTMQFSTWGFAHGTKVIQRQYAARSLPSFIGLTMGGLMLSGIVSYVAREAFHGRSPLSNGDLYSGDPGKESEAWAKMLTVGASQSGMGGMFGDLLFSQSYANGRAGPLQMLGGPLADNVTQAAQFGYDALLKHKVDGAKALRFAQGNTPFINVWYIKPMLDYMLSYGLQEHMNPGVLHRMEQSASKSGDPYFLPPSQYAKRY